MAINRHAVQGVKLTANFSLKEFFEGKAMPNEAIEMAYQECQPEKLPRVGVLACHLQEIRDKAMKHFGKERFKGLMITAGIRPKKWELMRGRSGNSQHTEYWAGDFAPVCAKEDFEEIMSWIFEKEFVAFLQNSFQIFIVLKSELMFFRQFFVANYD